MDRFYRLGPPSELLRTRWGVAGLGVLYFAVASASIFLLGSEGTGGFSGPVLWPASGLFLGALLVSDRGRWPALACAALAGSFGAHLVAGSSPGVAFGFAVPNSAEGLFAAFVVRGRSDDRRLFEDPRDVAVLVLGGALLVNAFTSLSAAVVASYGHRASLGDGWVRWWSADGLGMVALAPIVAAPLSARLRPPWRTELRDVCAVMAGLVVAAAVIAFAQPWDVASVLGGALALPLLFWSGWRWGARAAALGALGLALTAAYVAAHDAQLFAHGGGASAQVLVVQASLAIVVIAPLAFSVVAAAHGRAQSALAAVCRRLSRIIGTAPGAYMSVDDGGRLTEWSQRAEATFGWSSADVLGRRLDETIVPSFAREMWAAELERQMEAGGAGAEALQLRARHRSGRELQTELTIAFSSAAGAAELFVRDVSDRERFRTELERVSDELALRSEELGQSIREREDLRADLTQSQAREAKLKEELARIAEALAALEQEREQVERELTSTIAARDQALEETARERERLQAQLESTEQELARVRQLADEAERELEEARERQLRTDSELERVRQRAAEAEGELERARARQAETDEELERVRQQSTQTDAELERARGRQAETDAELERAGARQAETDAELEQARVRAAEAEAGLERARAREVDMAAELEQARQQAAEAAEELERAAARQAEMAAQLEQAAEQRSAMTAELQSVRVEYERTQMALAQAEQTHQKREQRWAAEQRRLEDALVATAKSLGDVQRERRLLEDHSSEVIARYDHRGICLYASPAWRELLGYESEDLVGRQGSEILHPDDRQLVQQARAKESETQFKARLRHKNGEFRYLETLFRPVRDEEGKLVEIETALRDISDGPAAQRLNGVPPRHDLTERVRPPHRLAG